MDETTELLRRHARQLEVDLESILDLIRYGAPDNAQYNINRIAERVNRALTEAYARHELVGL